jgi:hypothetical protein
MGPHAGSQVETVGRGRAYTKFMHRFLALVHDSAEARR